MDKLTVFEVVLKDTTPIIKENDPQNDPQKLSDRCLQIIELIRSNNSISKQDIAESLDVDESTIRRDIKEIRKYYQLEWEGPTKGGKWEIKKQ